MDDKILILGKGFIGERLGQGLGAEISERKINSLSDVQDELKKFNPAIIINCIGHTGRNVDDCELDQDKTLTANAFVPLIIAEVALRNNIRFIQISSGCIYHFDYLADEPIGEEKIPDYFDLFYSRSKIYAEQPLNILAQKFPILTLRLRMPLDNRPHPKNLLDKLINYKNIIDLPNSVTYLPDFIEATKHLIKIRAKGIYNVVNKGALRFPELLEVYKKYVPEFTYRVMDFKGLNLKRTNLIMSVEKLERSGFKVRDIKDVLEECVKDYLKTRDGS